MLSFSTEFPVEKQSLTAFCDAVAKWLSKSPHYTISEDQVLSIFTSETRTWENQKEQISCTQHETDDRTSAAFKHIRVDDDGISWTTTVGYDSDCVDSWISVRIERNTEAALPFVPNAQKPYIIRNFLEILRGGMDGELRVQNKAHMLSYSDINMAIRLINGDAEHHLPFVYVSMPFHHEHLINYDALAKQLSGIAHVIVEPSRDFSYAIKPKVFSGNPYGGYIGVSFASGHWTRIDPHKFASDHLAREAIFSLVRDSLLNRRPMRRCSFSNIEASAARKSREESRKAIEDSNAEAALEQFTQAFDKEIADKDDEIRDLETENADLQSKLHAASRSSGKSQTGTALKTPNEQELTECEFEEMILDALFEYRQKSVKDDTRRAHVIDGLLKANPEPSILKSKRNDLKNTLKDYTKMTSGVRRKLEEIGFAIKEDGKHYKLTYQGDSRYQYSLAKTPSDKQHAGKNAANEMGKIAF